jgi:hypothetical protein
VTVMLDSFFGVHPYVIRSGLWRTMKPGEKDLYVYLMQESERRCTREITATDKQVTLFVGAASRTLCNSRKRLQEYGLIQYQSGQGNRYTYTICNPKTGQPYLGDPRVPIVVPKRNRSKENEQQSLVKSTAPQAPRPPFAPSKPSQPHRTSPEHYGLPDVF